jgi:carboxymethylenebutenolidase
MAAPLSRSLNKWVEISVGDKSMPVYVCTPELGKPKGAILVLQEIYGVNSHIRSVTERLAAEGYLALAPDLFHRQGDRFEAGYTDAQTAFARAQKMSEEQALHDIDRVIATLDTSLHVGVVGFCMGGRIAFQVAFNSRVSGAVSFYGGRIAEKALKWTSQIQCPILLFYGEKDKHIPTTEIAQVKEALHEHSKDAEIVIYPSADHGFFCDERATYNEKAAHDAWNRTREFFAKNLK